MPSQPSLPRHWLFVPCCAGSTFPKLSYLTFLLALCAIIALWISLKFPPLLSISSISMSILINLDFFFFFYSNSEAMSPHLPSRYRESFCYLSYSLPLWVSPLARFFILFYFFLAYPLSRPCFYVGMLIVTVPQFLQWQETYRESSVSNGPKSDLWSPMEIVARVFVTPLNLK